MKIPNNKLIIKIAFSLSYSDLPELQTHKWVSSVVFLCYAFTKINSSPLCLAGNTLAINIQLGSSYLHTHVSNYKTHPGTAVGILIKLETGRKMDLRNWPKFKHLIIEVSLVFRKTNISINSMASKKCSCDVKLNSDFKGISRITILCISCEIAPRQILQDIISN